MSFKTPAQRRAAFAKKRTPKAAPKRLRGEREFSQEDANDIRLTVQDQLSQDYVDRGGDLTLDAVEAALAENGMPESWASSQAPLLHEEIVRQLREDEEAEHDDE